MGASLLSTGFSAFTATTTVSVSGRTVHFVGQIINAAYAVSTSSTNQTVNLGQYRNANFASVVTSSGKVSYTINLEDGDASVSTTAAVAFTGNADANDNTLLSVSNISGGCAGVASGVGIEVSSSKGVVLPHFLNRANAAERHQHAVLQRAL
ncbi:fimbrial protein [Lonsdalea quercina]|uniref:fimbrial protein n=1 Tax=Lonsdalea quercina TaxID=71657 RepID=UPI00397471D6